MFHAGEDREEKDENIGENFGFGIYFRRERSLVHTILPFKNLVSRTEHFFLGVLPAVESDKLDFIMKRKFVVKTVILLHLLVCLAKLLPNLETRMDLDSRDRLDRLTVVSI